MFESTLERDFLMLLEFDKNVERFEVQPIKLEWTNDLGKPHSYTPDVLVYYCKGKKQITLFEVKYRDDIKKNCRVVSVCSFCHFTPQYVDYIPFLKCPV